MRAACRIQRLRAAVEDQVALTLAPAPAGASGPLGFEPSCELVILAGLARPHGSGHLCNFLLPWKNGGGSAASVVLLLLRWFSKLGAEHAVVGHDP